MAELQLLFAAIVTGSEAEHLQRVLDGTGEGYENCKGLRDELRSLIGRGLARKTKPGEVHELPPKFHLSHEFAITDVGRALLNLREKHGVKNVILQQEPEWADLDWTRRVPGRTDMLRVETMPSRDTLPAQIASLVDRETRAWDEQDVETLLDLFHPDMVWPWPPTARDHDPATWVMVMGRYDRERWKQSWQELFRTHRLVHNQRSIVEIILSEQGDGALAVVDIDTVWVDAKGNRNHWLGRVGKVYSRLANGEWKLIAHTGALDYSR